MSSNKSLIVPVVATTNKIKSLESQNKILVSKVLHKLHKLILQNHKKFRYEIGREYEMNLRKSDISKSGLLKLLVSLAQEIENSNIKVEDIIVWFNVSWFDTSSYKII